MIEKTVRKVYPHYNKSSCQVCNLPRLQLYLKSAFIVGVSFCSDSVGDRVDHINLEKVGWGRIRIIQSLLLTEKSVNNVFQVLEKWV